MNATSNTHIAAPEHGRIPVDPQWPDQMSALSKTFLNRYDSCTQSILWAFMKELKMENRMVLRASGAMQGGMMSSLTCGVLTAGAMVLGILMGRDHLESGINGMMPIVMPSQRLMKMLTERIGGHSCLEMTGVDFTDLEAAMAYRLSDRHEACVTRVGEGSKVIAELLQQLDQHDELFRVVGRPS